MMHFVACISSENCIVFSVVTRLGTPVFESIPISANIKIT